MTWQGQIRNKDKHQSVILKVIEDQFLWFFHTLLTLKRNNNINVLDHSPLVANLLNGEGHNMNI
jgi:hypothetical protein